MKLTEYAVFRLVEKGRSKCGLYWPQEVNAMETYGSINVMNMDVEVESSGDFQTSTLCICNKAVSSACFHSTTSFHCHIL